MSAHTPGPWKVSQCRNGYLIETDEADIAEVDDFGGEASQESAANARLIAAAPELLDALQQASAQMAMAGDCIEAGRHDEALLHVRSLSRLRDAAIAKATQP